MIEAKSSEDAINANIAPVKENERRVSEEERERGGEEREGGRRKINAILYLGLQLRSTST